MAGVFQGLGNRRCPHGSATSHQSLQGMRFHAHCGGVVGIHGGAKFIKQFWHVFQEESRQLGVQVTIAAETGESAFEIKNRAGRRGVAVHGALGYAGTQWMHRQTRAASPIISRESERVCYVVDKSSLGNAMLLSHGITNAYATNGRAPIVLRSAQNELLQSGGDVGRQTCSAELFQGRPVSPDFRRTLLHFLRFEFVSQGCHLPSPC
jgi:hypothetical protein